MEKLKLNINNGVEAAETYKSQSSFWKKKQISTIFGNSV